MATANVHRKFEVPEIDRKKQTNKLYKKPTTNRQQIEASKFEQ